MFLANLRFLFVVKNHMTPGIEIKKSSYLMPKYQVHEVMVSIF